MDKGFNTIVETTRKQLTEVINSSGLPVSVVSLIIENILMEVRSAVEKSIQQEAINYAKQEQLKAEQVEWTEPVQEIE